MVGSLTSAASASWQPLGISAYAPGYDINPGNSQLFPWLSSQAVGWEKYRFTKLKIELIPGNPSTLPGRVYAMIDYDYDDDVPTSMDGMAACYGLKTSDVWQPLTMEVDCARMSEGMPTRYVTGPSRINGVEPRTVYGGYFFLACQGTTTACTWDMFVSYTCELKIPQGFAQSTPSSIIPRTVPLAAVPAGNYYPVSLSASGPVAVQMSGAGSVPSLTIPGGVGSIAGYGVLNTTEYRRGRVIFEPKIASNVGTPATNVPSLACEAWAFDAIGNYLGVATPVAAAGAPLAAAVSTAWATAAADLKTSWDIPLSALYAAYPAMVYLAFGVFNGSAKAGEVANALTGSIFATRMEL